MRDALGGSFNIMFVAVFITLISGYLAFSVSYSKAFKVKNKIISIIEQYQGYDSPEKRDIVNRKIEEYLDEIGYNRDIKSEESQARANKLKGPRDWIDGCKDGYCVSRTYVDAVTDSSGTVIGSHTGKVKCYYTVVTFVNVPIPIFQNLLPYLSFFQTSGDTMTIYED